MEQLAAAVDLEKCLVLSNMDLGSLRDPAALPVLTEAKQAEAGAAANPKRRRRGRLAGAGTSGGAENGGNGCCGWARRGKQGTEEQPAPAPEGPTTEQDIAAASEPLEQPAAVAAAAAVV